MAKQYKTVTMALMAVTLIVISGVSLNSCQKEEALTANTEEITSDKNQKVFYGKEEMIITTFSYYDELGNLRFGTITGWAFVYWYRGEWRTMNYKPSEIRYSPPSSSTSGTALSFDFEMMLVNAVVSQLQNEEDVSDDVINNFENYTMKVNGNELTQDFSISGESIDEDGNISEVKVNYYTIKNELFPQLIKPLTFTE
jgi:uncharacterized protein YacL (UPF0231 family)